MEEDARRDVKSLEHLTSDTVGPEVQNLESQDSDLRYFEEGRGDDEAGGDDSIVLTVEFLSDTASRTLTYIFRIALLVTIALIVLQLYWRYVIDTQPFMYKPTLYIANTVVAGFLLVCVTAGFVFYCNGIYKAWWKDRRLWHRRQRIYSSLGGCNMFFQLASLTFFLCGNAIGIVQTCCWVLYQEQIIACMGWIFFAALLSLQLLQAITLMPLQQARWYKGKAKIGLDLPAWVWILTFCVAFVPLLIIHIFRLALATNWFSSNYLCIKYYQSSCSDVSISATCQSQSFPCIYSHAELILTAVYIAYAMLLLAVYFGIILYSQYELKRLPYREHKISNVELGIQLETRMIAAIVFFVEYVVFGFVKMDDCSSILLNLMGNASFEVIMSAIVVYQGVLSTPSTHSASSLKLRAVVQDFAWMDKDIPRKLSQFPDPESEHVFSFETCLKLFYYCNLSYDLQEMDDSPYTPDVAMALYAATHFRLLWKPNMDSKCIVTWNCDERTLVLAFRGTASLANAVADLKIWRVPYPKNQGKMYLGTQPLVHAGFQESWVESGLQNDVMILLDEIFNEQDKVVHDENSASKHHVNGSTKNNTNSEGDDNGAGIKNKKPANKRAKWRVLTTGHSLGGSIAHLASFDIVSRWKDTVDLTSVTFGCPRTGNRAWAKRFAKAVPDSWDVFHPNDAVSAAGKYVFLYKRSSKVVLLADSGELIVRPSYAESSVQSKASSVHEHLLRSYARSLASVIRVEMGTIRGRRSSSVAAEKNEWHKDVSKDSEDSDAFSRSFHAGNASLRELVSNEYVQVILTSTKGMRQDSLAQIVDRGRLRDKIAVLEKAWSGLRPLKLRHEDMGLNINERVNE